MASNSMPMFIDLVSSDSESDGEVQELPFTGTGSGQYPNPNQSSTPVNESGNLVSNQNSASNNFFPERDESWIEETTLDFGLMKNRDQAQSTSTINRNTRGSQDVRSNSNAYDDLSPEFVAKHFTCLQPLVALEDKDITESFVTHSVQQMQDIESQMERLDAKRLSWGKQTEQEYGELSHRYVKLFQDHCALVGNDAIDLPDPCTWDPIDLTNVTQYPELNEAASVLINTHIERARNSGILIVELPSFEEILGAITNHPTWTLFVDAEEEYQLAENILEHVARLWKKRRISDYRYTWDSYSSDQDEDFEDPALSDPELREKLERNRARRNTISEECMDLDP